MTIKRQPPVEIQDFWSEFYNQQLKAFEGLAQTIDEVKHDNKDLSDKIHNLEIKMIEHINKKVGELKDCYDKERKTDEKDRKDTAIEIAKINLKQSWQSGLYGSLGGGLVLILTIVIYFLTKK